jgi:tetratricopeptide (TPR) repeat protein
MKNRLIWAGWFAGGGLLALALIVLAYQVPPVKYRLEWRVDAAGAILRGWMRPGETLPTPAGSDRPAEIPTARPSSTPGGSAAETTTPPTPLPTFEPVPNRVMLQPPAWEKQDWNNCGPATLALAMRYFGWEGDQFTISDLLKPDRGDRNVNIDELVYYVRTRAGWLNAEYRVGGTLELVKRFLAAGYPVVLEKGTTIDEGGGGWAGHYALATGYDDEQGILITQDTYRGPDREIAYAPLDQDWKTFNRAYFIVFPAGQMDQIERLLGADVDLDANREQALGIAQAEIEANPQDPYAWFNLGTNLVYFQRYGEAARAYDQALALGLPWRFTRYQFGPYLAYFHQGRFQDVYDLADATVFRTAKAEESLLWRGWARFRLGDVLGAIEDFRAALQVNPNYLDAQYALEYVGVSR